MKKKDTILRYLRYTLIIWLYYITDIFLNIVRKKEHPMSNTQYINIRSPFKATIISLVFFFSNTAIANINHKIQSDSVITLPIEADLKVLETYLNDTVPDMLADINEPNRTCLKAQYLKTNGIPKCKMNGYKISCKDRTVKIRTVPEIKCDIKGWVKRNGRISVSGEDKTLKFAFPIKAKVSTDAGIRETANASAILYIHASPHINEDWSVSVDIAPHFVWSQKPTITILKNIKINIQNKVEPQLRKKMEAFVKKVPQLLADLRMREKVNTAWNDIQEPLKINDQSETYLVFKPKSASYSGFFIVDNVLQTTISAQGKTEIIFGKPDRDHRKTQLCDLGSIPCQEGKFNFHLPVSISYQELIELSNKKLLNAYSIDLIKHDLPGVVKVSNPKIEKTNAGKLSITAHINYDNRSPWLKKIDLFNWFDVDGEITFHGSPRIDKETRCIVLDNLVYDSTTNNDLFDVLVDAAELQPIKSHFSDLLKYKFGQKIDDGIIEANKALKKFSKEDMNMSAYLHIASIEDIIINEKHITINTKLSGKVNASIGL